MSKSILQKGFRVCKGSREAVSKQSSEQTREKKVNDQGTKMQKLRPENLASWVMQYYSFIKLLFLKLEHETKRSPISQRPTFQSVTQNPIR